MEGNLVTESSHDTSPSNSDSARICTTVDVDSMNDEALLSLVRQGNVDAYEQLWRRHIDAALQVASRVSPGNGEDLASEAFLAVFNQVAKNGAGPKSSFRAYLLTTIRNTAMRWNRDARMTVLTPELEVVTPDDGLITFEAQARAAQVLDAFKALPDRWQRVLWMTEIEGVPRLQIAKEIGIKPNAV